MTASLSALRHHSDVLDVARSRGWPIPAAAQTAAEISAAAATVANAPEPLAPTLPSTAKDVAGWVNKRATARLQWRESGAIATELQTVVVEEFIGAVRTALRDYIERLCVEFDETAARFAAVLAIAPRDILGYETAEQLAAHTELLRTTSELTLTAAYRSVLATASGETETIGQHGAVWLILAPQPDADVDTVIAAVHRFANSTPADVDGWATASAIGLGMAGANEAPQRAEQYAAAMDARGRRAPSRGMTPSTWGKALEQARATVT